MEGSKREGRGNFFRYFSNNAFSKDSVGKDGFVFQDVQDGISHIGQMRSNHCKAVTINGFCFRRIERDAVAAFESVFQTPDALVENLRFGALCGNPPGRFRPALRGRFAAPKGFRKMQVTDAVLSQEGRQRLLIVLRIVFAGWHLRTSTMLSIWCACNSSRKYSGGWVEWPMVYIVSIGDGSFGKQRYGPFGKLSSGPRKKLSFFKTTADKVGSELVPPFIFLLVNKSI